jgi:hypothetical protein
LGFTDSPIINSPFEKPDWHFELDGDGQPTGKKLAGRRESRHVVPVPAARRRGPQQGALALEDKVTTNVLVNEIRTHVDQWRELPPSQWGVASAEPVCSCAFPSAFCTRDRGCSAHPAFPAPSDFKARNDSHSSGEWRREIADSCPSTSLRGALATKQSIFPLAAPWIASSRPPSLSRAAAAAPRNDGYFSPPSARPCAWRGGVGGGGCLSKLAARGASR